MERGAFRTAVMPAVGMGTRFPPTTKTVLEELLPVIHTETTCRDGSRPSGAQPLLIVRSSEKDGIMAHFVDDFDLEAHLQPSV